MSAEHCPLCLKSISAYDALQARVRELERALTSVGFDEILDDRDRLRAALERIANDCNDGHVPDHRAYDNLQAMAREGLR